MNEKIEEYIKEVCSKCEKCTGQLVVNTKGKVECVEDDWINKVIGGARTYVLFN